MQAMIFEPSLWQEPLGSIRIDLSWTRDEGALAARLTAFPFLILSQAVVASLSSAPRSGANPSPCFSSWKINLTFQVMLSWPALCWWEKSFPSGPFLVYSGHSAEQSQHIDLSPTDYLQRHQSVWNVERWTGICSFYNLFSLSTPCGFIMFTVNFHSFFEALLLVWVDLAMTMAHKTLAAPVRVQGIVW